MKYTVFILSVLFLASFSAAEHGPVEDTMQVETAVTSDDFRYYEEQGQVGYPAYEMEDGYMYENTTTARWVARQGSDAAVEEIIREAEREFDVYNISLVESGLDLNEDHVYTIELRYILLESDSEIVDQPDFSYEEFREFAPDEVEVKVYYGSHMGEAVMPVNVTQITRTQPAGSTVEEDEDEGGIISAILSLIPFL